MKRDYAARRAAVLEDLDGLRVEVDAKTRVGTLVLDRPPLNVISYRARGQIRALIEELDRDDEIAVVVIRGASGVFSSGGDVTRFPDIPLDRMSDLADDMGAPERCAKPVIAALERYALGAGFELALACDFRYATADTLVGQPEIALGQIPGSGGSARIARIAGLTRAKDMVMLGKRIPAATALDWALITAVVDDSRALDALVAETAARLAASAPVALRTLKRVLNAADFGLGAALEIEGQAYEKLRRTDDYREGIAAFAEKRAPRFTGR